MNVIHTIHDRSISMRHIQNGKLAMEIVYNIIDIIITNFTNGDIIIKIATNDKYNSVVRCER